jgi:hypothetical protein
VVKAARYNGALASLRQQAVAAHSMDFSKSISEHLKKRGIYRIFGKQYLSVSQPRRPGKIALVVTRTW